MNPTAAVDAFKAALAANDLAALAKLVGLDAEKLKADENTASTFAQIREAAAKQLTVEELGDRRVLHLGEKLWPFPFPLVKDEDGKWAFDTSAGLEEIVNRRVGENELEAISTMRELCRRPARVCLRGSGRRRRAGVRAEADQHARQDRRPVLAGRTRATATALLGNFADQAALEKAKKGEGYFGYRFRILTAKATTLPAAATTT